MIKNLLFLSTIPLLSLGTPQLIADPASTTTTTPVPMPVPPPVNSAPLLPAPPLSPGIQPKRDPGLIQRLTPRVEIWRPGSNYPQIPTRRSDKGNSDPSFVTGPELVTIRLRFNPQSAGEQVTIAAGRGLVIDPPQQVLTLSAQGDCAFLAHLEPDAPRGHLIIYCKNVRTVVPLVRAPLSVVEKSQTLSGGHL
jgi:hypothetical protein